MSSSRSRHELEAAGHALRAARDRARSRRAARRARRSRRPPRGCCRRSAGRRGVDRTCTMPCGRARVELEAVERERQRPGRDVGGLIERVGDRPPATRRRAPAPRGSSTLITRGRVGGQHLEQPALGREVVLHVAVEVEMVARQVREDAGGETGCRRRAAAPARATTLPSRTRRTLRSTIWRINPCSSGASGVVRVAANSLDRRCGMSPSPSARIECPPLRRSRSPGSWSSSCRSCR